MKIDKQENKEDSISNGKILIDGIGSGPNVLKSPIVYEQSDIDKDANLNTVFLECFRKFSTKTLLFDAISNSQWTGQRLLDATSRLACKLGKHLQFGPGKTVLLLCEHHDREIVMALGCFISGCAIYPHNPLDCFEEIQTICSMVPSIDLIATQSKHHKLAVKLSQVNCKAGNEIPIIWVDDKEKLNKIDDNIILMDDIIEDANLVDLEYLEMVGRDLIKARECSSYYMLTSGSTGFPKVVDNSQWGLLSNARSMCLSTQTIYDYSKPNERLLPLNGDTILAGDLPMDHGAGIGFLILSIMLGARLIILPVDDVEALCKAIGKYQINFLINGATKVFKFLKKIKEDATRGTNVIDYDLTSLRHISNVGAKINFLQLIRDVEQLLPNLRVTQSYGCTEVGHVATLPLCESCIDMQSVGWLYPGVLGIVVDSDGNQLGPNERGELHLWADSLFTKYICNAGIDAAKALADCHDSKGYYKTGDLVHYDERGRLYIHGRIKETLTLKGEWKITPAELEAVVNEHPLIEFSIVIGVPDSEVPGIDAAKAFIKLINSKSAKFMQLMEKQGNSKAKKLLLAFETKDYDFISKDIYEFAANRTAPEKHLRGGVRILEDFPKNGRLQKIDRKALKLMA